MGQYATILRTYRGLVDVTDRVTSKERSWMMSAVHGIDTVPELYVRGQLFAAGLRYRLHVASLPGKPDIVLPRRKTVVFVNGCFWHGHACARGRRPVSNTTFWNAKLDANIRRDRRNQAALRAAGWRCVVVWQCRWHCRIPRRVPPHGCPWRRVNGAGSGGKSAEDCRHFLGQRGC